MGKYPERLVNAALVIGICVNGACNTDNGIICTIAARDIKRLRTCGRGCGCRIRILSRHGLVFMLRPLKFEPLLLALTALLVTAAVLMSRRLWFIKIACGGMDRSAVLSELEIAGVRRGSMLRSISPSELSSL
ncbi:MAG: sporulation protein YqfD, partial [Clostridia bacterium]|nr:sporulation protein YqfD [Clostridia bacterium]